MLRKPNSSQQSRAVQRVTSDVGDRKGATSISDVQRDAEEDIHVDDCAQHAEVPCVLAEEVVAMSPLSTRPSTTSPKTDLHDTEASRSTCEGMTALPTFATIDEVADLLRLERKAVYRLAQRGELPGCRRLGRTFRVHVPSVVKWFEVTGQHRDRKREKAS